MRRWIFVAPLAALAAALMLFAAYALRHDPHVNPVALVGRPAPLLRLSAVTGRPDQPTPRQAHLINFFASWCAPCRQEHPLLLQMKARGVPIVGVAYKDRPDAVVDLLGTEGDPYTEVLADPDGRAFIDYGLTGVPETFAVDAHDRIVDKHAGPLTIPAAQALLDRARIKHEGRPDGG